MLERDAAVTVIDVDQPGWSTARASPVVDGHGAQRSTLLFPPHLEASLPLPDGSSVALDQLSVRATEYTVGPAGEFALPAPLPPASLYTHLTEFSVDEADQAGAEHVVFDPPVVSYTENGLDLPVGAGLPSAFYEARESRSVPAPTGRILGVVSVEQGLAQIDLEGDGQPSDAAALAAAGITDDERAELGALALWPGTEPLACDAAALLALRLQPTPQRDRGSGNR